MKDFNMINNFALLKEIMQFFKNIKIQKIVVNFSVNDAYALSLIADIINLYMNQESVISLKIESAN